MLAFWLLYQLHFLIYTIKVKMVQLYLKIIFFKNKNLNTYIKRGPFYGATFYYFLNDCFTLLIKDK